MPLRRQLAAASVMGLAMAMAGPAMAQPGPPTPAQRSGGGGTDPGTIRVAGRAIVTAAPERASVDIGVATRAPGSREAVTSNEREVSAVLRALQGMGEGVTVETIGYAVSPEYERDDRAGTTRIAGYRALTMLRATLRDLGRVGDVIDTATKAGANEVAGVRFMLQDEQAVRAKALREAAVDARAKAEALASALGVRLSRVVSASESEPTVRPMRDVRALVAESEAAGPPLPPGALEVEAFVVLTMAFLPS